MTEHERAVFSAEVHAPTLAVAEELAVFAWLQLLHPLAIAVWFEAIFPDLPKIILIDIALIVLTSDTRACRNTAVNQNTCHTHACCTMKEVITDFALIIRHKALAGVRDMQSFFAFLADIIQYVTVLLGRE